MKRFDLIYLSLLQPGDVFYFTSKPMHAYVVTDVHKGIVWYKATVNSQSPKKMYHDTEVVYLRTDESYLSRRLKQLKSNNRKPVR